MRTVVFSVLAVAGCGFRPLGGNDMAGANVDLANADLASNGPDLAVPVGGTGPGPWGALPTGYCCTKNEECRSRSCQSYGCADDCDGDDSCNALPGYHCVGATMFDLGACVPVNMGQGCTPATQFHYGGKKLGECCVATHDGMSGLECEGGRCGASGDINNPYICTNACAKGADCPGNFQCAPLNNNLAICVPLADPYTCK